MYWCKSKAFANLILIGSVSLITCLQACRPDVKETGPSLKYFDLKGFFKQDSLRLVKKGNIVFKTITHNGITESKKVSINNWGRELDLFTGSDINKPAWRNSYVIVDNDDILIYKAKYPELKMREMVIKKEKKTVKWILIFNRTKNILYQTNEKLSYFPDSLYLIEKDQHVRLMGVNVYKIEGVIGH